MKTFQHQLWGYEINLPADWVHQRFGERDGFAADPTAFSPDYQGNTLVQLLIQGEWNSLDKPIDRLWNQHLGRTSLMLGAKKIASASWQMAGAQGYEVEIVLPKRSRKRLWAGILERGALVLKFLGLHWKQNRDTMEPLLTSIISSFRLVSSVDPDAATPEGLPLPEGAEPTDPGQVVTDISHPDDWRAYKGKFNVGGLQAFYIRELRKFDWQIADYLPYPGPEGSLPFARMQLEKDQQNYTLGLLPGGKREGLSSIVLKNAG